MEDIIKNLISDGALKKIVLSRPSDKKTIKAAAVPFLKDGRLFIQLETFLADGKALHKNLPAGEAPAAISALLGDGSYRQADIIAAGGSCTVMRSSSGKLHIKNNIKPAEKFETGPHDGEKNYILNDPSAYAFLALLGIGDAGGRVYDKKRAKYRQINRFLELAGDVLDKLPEGKLIICDLCCGKAYLTFALYWYLNVKLGREAELWGVDLKEDVIARCSGFAEKLGYGGLHFICGDAYDFTPPSPPSMVISLHACDTATDIVLAGAVKAGAKVIMSTPCCHHELNRQLTCPALGFIAEHSILRQKLCDAATDALRALRLECEGYAVEAVELVDPDETPKNVLLRAVKRKTPLSGKRAADLAERYRAACAFLGASPALEGLLPLEK